MLTRALLRGAWVSARRRFVQRSELSTHQNPSFPEAKVPIGEVREAGWGRAVRAEMRQSPKFFPSLSSPPIPNRSILLAVAMVAAIGALIYGQTGGFSSLDYDDPVKGVAVLRLQRHLHESVAPVDLALPHVGRRIVRGLGRGERNPTPGACPPHQSVGTRDTPDTHSPPS